MIVVRIFTTLQSLLCSRGDICCRRDIAPSPGLNARASDGIYEDDMWLSTSRLGGTNTEDQVTITNYTPGTMAALNTLKMWYNERSGIFDTTGWWNSANCLTVIADYCSVDHRIRPEHVEMFNNTLNQAPKTNLGQIKIIQQGRVHTIEARDVPPPDGFLNGYYDDEGWWALAWIRVFDVTNDLRYLQTAATIYEDMKAGGSPCGGIWWDKAHTAQVAIANELFLNVAASLANRADALSDPLKGKSYYHDTANKQWDWFLRSGMINDEGTINDGLDENCQNNHEAVWSYNQGVILGGLMELHRAAPNQDYVNYALSIAHSAIDHLSDQGGILTEQCEHQENCGQTGSQFKGVFMRNLPALYYASADPKIRDFVGRNAASIMAQNFNDQNEMSIHWGGPFVAPANASTHSSAMDALVAAVAIG